MKSLNNKLLTGQQERYNIGLFSIYTEFCIWGLRGQNLSSEFSHGVTVSGGSQCLT